MRYIALLLLWLAASFNHIAQAQEPPGRVGRLAYTQGAVSVYQDPELGWDKAYVNTPITSENSIWTDRGSRAELRAGATAIRLDATTQLDVSRLDDDEIDASIDRGAANIRVRYKQAYERITLSTPQARFTIQSDGRYRVDVDIQRDESRLTVFAGDARMESQGGALRVRPGTTVRVFGGPSSSYVVERAASDAFDRWADVRDREWSDSRARQYVSTEMTGYEDLDRYGEWAQEPDYGAVWFPTRVAADWAPYRTGHWAHVRPWGWTWVDDAPWGYAPFHYGRWVFVRNRWAWSPGERVPRPAWAPALVGWVGGANWTVGVSGGSAPVVGWYPLAPWERYEPWYRSNRTSTDRINVAVRDRAPRQFEGRGEDWRRFNRDRATTVVQREALVDRRPVQGARVQVNVDALRQQQPVPAAQVQQVLPQGNEMIRRRTDRPQAPVAAPPAPQAQPAQQAPPGGAPQARGSTEGARPNFARRGPGAPAPAPAPANQPPVQQAAPAPVNPFNPVTPPVVNPAARGPAPQAGGQQQQQQLQQQQQQAREAQQQQERAQREAQQQQQLQQQRQVREAQQQQERAQRDAQQMRETQLQQERARTEAAQQQQAQQQRQVREAQQQQERAAREGQQQREAQQRQQQEAAQREAQQQQQAQQQRQAREAQQQQERAQREAQQQQQRSAQQLQQQQERAAREAQPQAQQAAREAQQATQRAAQQAQEAQQQQNRAARGGQPPPQPQAQPQAQQPAPQANPAARGNREQKDKEEKDAKDKKDKEDKQR